MNFFGKNIPHMNERTIHGALLCALAFLLSVGLLAVMSSSGILAENNYGDSLYFFKKQLVFVTASLILTYLFYSLKIAFLERFAMAIYAFGILLLILVLLPGIGKSAGGAARWLVLGPFRLQGGEVFKIAMCVFLAASLAKKRYEIHAFGRGLVPHLLIPGIAMVLLMMEPDFGTTFLVGAVAFAILFVSGARVAYLLGIIIVALPLGFHAIASSPYRVGRVIAFLDPWAHRQDIGYQVVESLITFGSGQWLGMGFGAGTSKLFFLPAAHTDFILAVIGEEAGFVGVMLVFLAFATIAFCGFKIAASANDRFAALLAVGLTCMLVLQAAFNCFVVMGLAPTKGVTLPFVSYGGSSLLACAAVIGILMRINLEGTKKS